MKQWTIMVYMAGDNNLSEDMVTGLIGMKKNLEATFNADVAFLAYYDTGALAFPTVRCDFTKETKGDRKSKKKAARPAGSPFIEPDANEETSAQSIYDFVEWCVKTRGHDAENYALIFSGHGDGFQPATFLSDENPVSSLTVPGLRKVLKKIKKDLLGGKKLGVIGFDSCVMGTLEVAYELSDAADLMVASQGLVPNNGWNYCTIAEEISRASRLGIALDKETLAGIFTRSFVRAYWDYAFYSARSVDVSVIDLARTEALAAAVYRLGEQLCQTLASENPLVERKIRQAILTSHDRAQTHVFEQCVDVRDFCENLLAECDAVREETAEILEIVRSARAEKSVRQNFEQIADAFGAVADACRRVAAETDACVRQSFYLGAEFQYSNGLSIYFPWSYISYLISKNRYLNRDFALGDRKDDSKKSKTSAWTRFLDLYLAKTMRPPRGHSEKAFFLFDLPEKTLGETEKEMFRLGAADDEKLNSPYNKLNSPYNKLNSPYNKLNSPYNKLNSPYNKLNSPYNKLDASNGISSGFALGIFGRVKNFPWAPTLWQPAAALMQAEDEPEKQT